MVFNDSSRPSPEKIEPAAIQLVDGDSITFPAPFYQGAKNENSF